MHNKNIRRTEGFAFSVHKVNKNSEAQIAWKIVSNLEQSEAEINMLRKKRFNNDGEMQQAITLTYFNINKLQL